jgi:hypothetical protein
MVDLVEDKDARDFPGADFGQHVFGYFHCAKPALFY